MQLLALPGGAARRTRLTNQQSTTYVTCSDVQPNVARSIRRGDF
jgi:hypothetical protein